MAAKTEIRLSGLQVALPGHRRVDRMAVVAGDEKRLVFADIPVYHAPHILVAAEAF
jgi:hypothetical protein